ncbi:MAG: flagellar hook-associated protein FlgK [Hyphomicrobiales bacterium]|nr:flagellar hook-associated protein FlgK [Hyphomicrobiales bacterium]
MNLQSAFYAARSALSTNAAQTALLSRNISSAGDATYSVRTLRTESLGEGGVRAVGVQRAADAALQEAALSSVSVSAASQAESDAIAKLAQTIGDTQGGASPTAQLAAFQTAMVTASGAPQDASAVTGAITAAKNLAASLQGASATTQQTRADADKAMANSVATINSLLSQFDEANKAVVRGTASGSDVADALDQRGAILQQLAQQIGVSAVSGRNGDVALYTDSGVALYQDGARSVSMAPTSTFTAGQTGRAVYVDGVAVTGASAAAPLQSGALAGLARVRDVTAPAYQAQLDEVARGLINASAQNDPAGVAPARTGLFTWSGGPALPGGMTRGLASDLSVDPAVDPARGGDWTALRDGGIGSATYKTNTTGAASYSDNLVAISNALNAAQTFDARTQLQSAQSVASLATASASWISAADKTASDTATQKATVATQAASALSAATGVNIDDQMSRMLDMEHSYQASAKILSSIEQMYTALFTAVPATP